jgi:peptide deformylase
MIYEKGLGIAAPQIGVSKQICILQIPEYNERYGKLTAFPLSIIINPVITVLDEATQGFWEGCLSIPGIRGYVLRPKKIKIVFLNERGESIEVIAEGLAAVVFQHEIDHLYGNLYIDKVVNKKIAFIEEFQQFGIESSEKVLDD